MQFDDVILGRRSIRGYKPDPVPKGNYGDGALNRGEKARDMDGVRLVSFFAARSRYMMDILQGWIADDGEALFAVRVLEMRTQWKMTRRD